MFKRWLRRKRALLGFAFKKPVGIKDVRDRIAYQALWTSRLSAFLSLLAVVLSALVAFVAIGSLRLNSQTAEQARRSSEAQILANKTLADAAARQAEASISAAKTSRDSLVANQRAWIGPSDASIRDFNIGGPLKASVTFTNTGREPAPTNTSLTPKLFTIEEWNNGLAVQDIERSKSECLQSPFNNQTARVTFPTTGFTTFQLGYDGTQLSLRDVQKLSVTADLAGGKQVVVFKGCFVYVTIEEVRRTSFCYFYQFKVSSLDHLNYCTVGQAAN
ncbi:hypothetical protein [Bradyrhizobium japonicum]|uniref:hypothetical protein n=1 Tax=Bradyrhizobium japonicum TaxID=375 RepID=UPI001BA69481|nr:hypothetical protein [Bradyrhizobium japonicum]MBR0957250.1 hypothetical protein [Bradyrhizobium japonicum]